MKTVFYCVQRSAFTYMYDADKKISKFYEKKKDFNSFFFFR